MLQYLDLKKINGRYAEEIKAALEQVTDSGWYLMGNEIAAFEQEYAQYIGTTHCVTCANGLDALTLILRAYIEQGVLHRGDEIIVPANTYIASILSITENDLVPILVEPDIRTFQIDDNKIEEKISERTRALMIVHLYGRCAYTERIAALCSRHHLKLIEDNAQAHGCTWQHRHTGSLGDVAAHSFYPGKNLGALGDAGAVTTDDEDLAATIRSLGNYGSNRKYIFDFIGRNSRMDELQAAVLRVKLKYLDAENHRRRQIAAYYIDHIDHPDITVPKTDYLSNNVFHIFPILCPQRDQLQAALQKKGIGTLIHYPLPPHQQQCYRTWNHLSFPITERIHCEELSIPLHPALEDIDVDRIVETINHVELI